MARRYRTNKGTGGAICAHRDVSVCEACFVADERLLDVLGETFLITDPEEYAELQLSLKKSKWYRGSTGLPTVGGRPDDSPEWKRIATAQTETYNRLEKEPAKPERAGRRRAENKAREEEILL